MRDRRVGLCLLDPFGGVGTAAALGPAALRRGVGEATPLVTALPLLDPRRLDAFGRFVVGAHVSSAEPPFEPGDLHASLARLTAALDRRPAPLPPSALYAYAALDLGLPFLNFTPSLGSSLPALEELALARKAAHGGKDGK